MYLKASILFFIAALTAQGDELLPVLKVQDQTYSNVTVTAVTATDIYFLHARGVGSAKLKSLTPDLQKHFHYDATKALNVEKAQVQATAQYRAQKAATKPAPRPVATSSKLSPSAANGEDFVAPKLYARSVLGNPAPKFEIEKWITGQPSTSGKFVLIDFWATWCGPCRQSIPELNAFHAKYEDRLAIIGVSDETERDVRKMTTPKIDYAVAIDTRGRMNNALQITGIPHCILIDPYGIVRYEGMPQYLDDRKLEHFLAKYSN